VRDRKAGHGARERRSPARVQAPAAAAAPAETATPDEWDNKRPSAIWWCKSWANASYGTLVVAAGLLASFAYYRLFYPVSQRNEAVALSEAPNHREVTIDRVGTSIFNC
jgi:hypothetical protein